MSFLTQIKEMGREGSSKYVTIPKDILNYLKLEKNDFVKISIEKVKKKE